MDARFSPLELLNLGLNVASWWLPICPDCSCTCGTGVGIGSELTTALKSSLDFCHSVVAECKGGPRTSYSFSLFWLGFFTGILLVLGIFLLLWFRRRPASTTTPTGPATQRPLAISEPANPKRLRELGLIQ